MPPGWGLDKFYSKNGLFCLPAMLIKIAYSARNYAWTFLLHDGFRLIPENISGPLSLKFMYRPEKLYFCTGNITHISKIERQKNERKKRLFCSLTAGKEIPCPVDNGTTQLNTETLHELLLTAKIRSKFQRSNYSTPHLHKRFSEI